jgi:hypothetical protein
MTAEPTTDVACDEQPTVDVRASLEMRLREVLNHYSQENASDTPDFILAEYMMGCLDTFNQAVRAREKWYGRRDFV